MEWVSARKSEISVSETQNFPSSAGEKNIKNSQVGVEESAIDKITNFFCYVKYSRRDNIADSAHFRETAKDAGAA